MIPTRTRNCKQCGAEFTCTVGRGKDRAMCSDFCRGRARHKAIKSQPLCAVEGCRNHRAYANPAVCNSCYYRLRRTGTLERRQWKYRSVGSNGYIRVSTTDHPLSVCGFVYEHRQVLYDAIGPGPHACHWCKAQVDWVKGRCVRGPLVPDHLDGNKQNNALANLVPACNRCNSGRGLFLSWLLKHQDDPFIWEMYQASRKVGS